MASSRRARAKDDNIERYEAVRQTVGPGSGDENIPTEEERSASRQRMHQSYAKMMSTYNKHQQQFEPQVTSDPPTDEDRSASRRRMDHSYEQMMNVYANQQEMLSKKPGWIPVKTKLAVEPDPLTVTAVKQTQDMMRVANVDAMFAETQSSNEWLQNHSIAHQKLALKDLVDRGHIGRPGYNKDNGKVQQHIKFDATLINEFEYKLNLTIEHFTKRIKWLLQGSKRMFGLVKGMRVGVLVDVSDANCGFGRLTLFQESLLHLLDEQLSKKTALFLMSFGTEPRKLWNTIMDVHSRAIDQAKEWVSNLRNSGGCNLLKALKQMFRVKGLDTVLIVLGSVPDQKADLLCDYVEQLRIGSNVTIQTVAYDCSNHLTNMVLRNLAENSGGRYHCYTSACEEQIYTGTDISALLKEIQQAQDILNKIQEMRQGLLGTALVTVMSDISNEVAKLPQSRFLPRPPGHEMPLQIDMPKFQPSTSGDWLSKHGLKARNLDLYQVLAPNAYSYREEFVPVIRKTVQSHVHQKAMTQFQWHDGSIKNVHVDMTQLFEYQKQLGATVKLYEKRLDWLASSSRKIFGAVSEKNVVILVDLSVSNMTYLVHIQHSVRLLLEQQMANKEYFNIIGFGSETKAWKPTMVKPTPENLQAAWMWVLEMQCSGSRNFLGALRTAIENDEESKHNIEVEGVYVFTSGIPDQMQDAVCAYVEQACAGRVLRVHTILFNVEDYDAEGAIPSRYANITKTAEYLRSVAQCSEGRFHWFRETGIIESDDIAAVSLEIEKALNFSKKCAFLVESVKRKYDLDFGKVNGLKTVMNGESSPPPLPSTTLKALLPPKHTILSQHRMQLVERDSEDIKPSSFRPSTAIKHEEEEPTSVPKRPHTAKNGHRVQKAFFFTEDKHDVGSVFKKYPVPKVSTRVKGMKLAGSSIPDSEGPVTSRTWLKQYSLVHLKLDLMRLVSGPECRHIAKPVKVLGKAVESKHCATFPTINIGGTLRHLHLRPGEIQEYENQVERTLKRYLRRLQWLLSGSRRVFGVVVEKRCVFLIDTSGSMALHMDELKKELASLVWEQLHRNKVKFNFICFSQNCEKWESNIVDPYEHNCHDAVKWVSTLTAHGNTCTLEALQMAFEDKDIDAVYLLTDGKPDSSTSLVLREVANMNEARRLPVHTISYNCPDTTANNFLKMLAAETGGRYHRCHSDFEDAHRIAHRLLTETLSDSEVPSGNDLKLDLEAFDNERNALPEFESDDLKRLAQEITLARRYLVQAHSFQVQCDAHQTARENDMTTPHSCLDKGESLSSPMRSIRPLSAKV